VERDYDQKKAATSHAGHLIIVVMAEMVMMPRLLLFFIRTIIILSKGHQCHDLLIL
jgi:hypothetical protein